MFKHAPLWTLLALLALGGAGWADDQGKLSDEERAAIELLIKQLDADDFPVRENAEKRLTGMGAKVAPLLKKAVEESTAAELKARGARILERLEASGEVPAGATGEKISELANKQMQARQFAQAAKLFQKAVQKYREELAQAGGDESKSKALALEINNAEQQARLCERQAQGGGLGAGVQHVRIEGIAPGQGGVQIRMISSVQAGGAPDKPGQKKEEKAESRIEVTGEGAGNVRVEIVKSADGQDPAQKPAEKKDEKKDEEKKEEAGK